VHISHLQYLPIAPLFFALLVVALTKPLVFVKLGILRYAYTRLGVSSDRALLLLFRSLLGNYVNNPIAQLPEENIVFGPEISYFGVRISSRSRRIGLAPELPSISAGR
jgi:uncharacterized membrane protein